MSHPTPPMGPPARKTGGWLQTHKATAAAGGVAIAGVLALALYQRYKNSQAGSSSSVSPGTSATGTAGVQGTYDSSAQDLYDALEQQISSLQSQISQSQTSSPATSGQIVNIPPPVTVSPWQSLSRKPPKPMPAQRIYPA